MSDIRDIPIGSDGLEKISGMVEKCIYTNEENGYGIFDFAIDTNELITIVGTLPYICEGDSLVIYGKWVNNPKYGAQFKVEQYEKIMPADSTAIFKYLSSGAIKGIGPKTARKIVDEFGDETFDVMENHPDWLADINGITFKKANEIAEDFKKKSGMRAVVMFFREFFGTTMTVKIYQKWGGKAVDIAKNNPYRLCEEIEGVGFEKAEEIAKSLGLDSESGERIKGGIIYVLSYNANQNGHTCLPVEKLVTATASLLLVDKEKVLIGIEELLLEKKICSLLKGGDKYIFTSEAYRAEKYISEKLVSIDRLCINVLGENILRYIEKEEIENGIRYAELQRLAISSAMSNGVMVLTGGPGTGKTTVVKALLKIFKGMGMRVALSAPTGRAAKRLSETTSSEAKTVHRLLEMNFSEKGFSFLRNEKNYLDEDVIIVDEVSMADVMLFEALLRAIKPGGRLVIIGDSNQLPSVGAGNVLHDLIESQKFAVVELNEIFRQAGESLIITNAHRINNGEMPILSVRDNDFFFLPVSTDEQIANTIVDLCKNRLPRAYGVNIFDGIQVITPSRKGATGTEYLNVLLQQALNPTGKKGNSVEHRNRLFSVGDKIMQTRNNYQIAWNKYGSENSGLGVFNGDIGEILDIDRKEGTMLVRFDDREVSYDYSLLDDIEHAYAITVHKSQGSEYPIVIIPAYRAPEMLLTRNLFYTAVTRAQKMVIVVGREDVVSKMVENDRLTMRYTGLFYMLGENK